MTDEDFRIDLPRIAKKQTHRSNIQTESPESYFRITVFNEFLDSVILHLKERFTKHKAVMSALNILLIAEKDSVSAADENKLKILKETYSFDLTDCGINILTAEYRLWKRKLQAHNRLTAMEALQECNASIFPNIYKLLKILVTLPVTSCTAEGPFQH